MPSIFSWIKKELIYIKDSFKEIVKGFIIFVLASSGLVCAIILRYLGYNGTEITFFSLAVELISLFLCYLLLKGFLKSEEDQDKSKGKESKP